MNITKKFPLNILLPNELDKKRSISLDEFKEYASGPEVSDLDKRKKLRNKIITKNGSLTHSNNRTIRYSAFFIPKRSLWNDLSIDFSLADDEKLKDNKWLDNFDYTLLKNGITVSVKGMPTGIYIDHPTTGYSGYWSNIFILFEDPSIKFDIGRKSIHGMQARIYKEHSRTIFNEFLKYIAKYASGEIHRDTEWDRDEVFNEIDSIPNLRSEKTTFAKTPKDQEASVAGMFFELIGNRTIENITPLTSGYRNKYDLYAKWGNRKVIIEFKSKLRNILKDFSDERKMFDEMNCVVCWDISEEDIGAFRKKAIELEAIEHDEWEEQQEIFPHSTHKLTLSAYVKPIYIIDLKKVTTS